MDEPTWMFAIPLLHFLLGSSEPFQPVELYTKHVRHHNGHFSEWWGVKDVIEAKENLRGNRSL